jgi:pimeloyl-ACP methyl ester carboxylesterase
MDDELTPPVLDLPAEPPPPGRMLTAGKHRLHARLVGSGAPVVVIEPGIGSTSVGWWEIGDDLAQEGIATVLYDRAGHAWSSRARDARRSLQIATDLHALLAQLAEPPFVLVGHSAGGVHLRAFARLYPAEVAGMVLVESSSEAQHDAGTSAATFLPRALTPLLLYASVLVPHWLSRRAFARGRPSPYSGRNADLELAAWLARSRRTLLKELRAFRRLRGRDSFLQPGDLGEKPLIVLTAAPPRDDAARPEWERWLALQADLARLSHNSRHIVAPEGGHDLHAEAPALVLQAIRDVVESARHGNAPLAQR